MQSASSRGARLPCSSYNSPPEGPEGEYALFTVSVPVVGSYEETFRTCPARAPDVINSQCDPYESPEANGSRSPAESTSVTVEPPVAAPPAERPPPSTPLWQ